MSDEQEPAYGTEDVLAAPAPPASPPPKARRSPWNRGRDRAIAALIAVGVVALGLVIAVTSDSAAGESSAAPRP